MANRCGGLWPVVGGLHNAVACGSRGFAALPCGKLLAFRYRSHNFGGFASAAQPQRFRIVNGKPEAFSTEGDKAAETTHHRVVVLIVGGIDLVEVDMSRVSVSIAGAVGRGPNDDLPRKSRQQIYRNAFDRRGN